MLLNKVRKNTGYCNLLLLNAVYHYLMIHYLLAVIYCCCLVLTVTYLYFLLSVTQVCPLAGAPEAAWQLPGREKNGDQVPGSAAGGRGGRRERVRFQIS